ncbi:LIM and SH3 domain 1-like [Paramuricea clavata]|uniref:LIM and SH3 domain 1-like n=1 Tax=Paramuricea clavata TaxID=317549 RepID=A0A7D9D8B2_PARCT|nr:LIM and SH3 domain 1-like [Paramuricea clavata]
MNPKCARCDKTVYPVEKLNCLDKYWHKKCFTCEVCNMKLTMKNYKGYNKNPYCNAHYPTTKFTAVADTPEQRRLNKQTKTQSQVEYHKKFEEEKGHYTAVADDPETERAKRAMQQQSGAAYTRQRDDDGGNRPPPLRHDAPERSYTAPEPAVTHHVPPPEPAPAPAAPAPPLQPRYRALYDYNAADEDEISINEGDIIIDANIIDSGWMEGRNQRTGQFGMLPSNYVEEI